MGLFFNDNKPTFGFVKPLASPADKPTPEEQKLLERIAEQIIEQYSETLKKLGDE